VARREKGLATLPQVRVLSKRGVNATNATFARAREAMDHLAASGWRAPAADLQAIIDRSREPGEDIF